MTNRGKSPAGAFVQSPLGVFGSDDAPLPPELGTWEVISIDFLTAPGTGADGFRPSDCQTGDLDPGEYKSVILTAKTIGDVIPKDNATGPGASLHALGTRSGYVYTFVGPYVCNYINGPPGGNAPLESFPGEFKPYNAWELLDADNVYQCGYLVPRINDRDAHVSADDIEWFDATIITDPDDLIDLSAPWTVTGVRTIPANTAGPGNVGSREDCTLDVFPEEMWGINLTAVSPGYIGWASFRFRNLQWQGQTNGYTYQHDNRPDLEKRYLCNGAGGALSRNVLNLKYPGFPVGQALPFEDILGIAGAADARINQVEVIIPKSVQATQPVDLGETVAWSFQ